MTPADPTASAAELAERILDEVSGPAQDWCNIAAWARRLAVLAEAACARRREER